jgi:hypothetical protein
MIRRPWMIKGEDCANLHTYSLCLSFIPEYKPEELLFSLLHFLSSFLDWLLPNILVWIPFLYPSSPDG